jgi:hypothetical protein
MNALIVGAARAAQWELTGSATGANTEQQRENVANLCTTMMWLRSWWESRQDMVRAVDGKVAAEVHDHFVDGAIFARGIGRGMQLELDEQRIKNYRWGNSAQSLRLVVAVPAVAERRTA